MRGESQGPDRGDEGGDRGSAATEGFGQRRWAAAGKEERKSSEDRKIELNASLDVEQTAPKDAFSVEITESHIFTVEM